MTEDHLAARRRQILDGARRCFAEYGYDKATVRRLEHTIGLSRGAIFHHFRDKDTLFFELARDDDFVGVQTYTRNRFGPQGPRGPHVELGKRLPPEQPETKQHASSFCASVWSRRPFPDATWRRRF